MTLGPAEFWTRLAEISFLNMLLSGDNAVVIALAVRALPPRQRLLGQLGGTIGAVVLRLLFVGVISLLLRVPYLRLAGGLLLIWIAFKLVRPIEEETGGARHGASFWESIWIIVVADITMSLDNVLAVAAAAHGDMLLVTLGIGMSVPIAVRRNSSARSSVRPDCTSIAESCVTSSPTVLMTRKPLPPVRSSRKNPRSSGLWT